MKKTLKAILLAMLALSILTISASADEWAIEVAPFWSLPSNSNVEGGWGIKGKVKYAPNDDPLCPSIYLHGSYSSLYQRRFGQRAGDVQVYGGGLGLEAPVTRWLSVYGEVGYFHPESALANDIEGHYEVPWLYWREFASNHQLPLPAFTSYGYKLSGNVGGEAGINLHYSYKQLCLGLGVGYRFLHFEEQWYGYVGNVTMWETKSQEDFGGVTFALIIEYTF